MPGISAILNASDPQLLRESLALMAKAQLHEKFYASTSLIVETLRMGVASVGLQNSFAGNMPLWNASGDVALILSGETFIDQEELRRLLPTGSDTSTSTPQYVLNLYCCLGPEFLPVLDGWFSGLIIDRRERKVLLFNDRYGLGRIYFTERDGAFFLSSEAKSLLKVVPECRSFDQQSLGEYLACGVPLQNRTLYKDISLLPGASLWTFSADGLKKSTYFSPETWEHQSSLDFEDYYDALKSTFPNVLKKYFAGDQQLGLSLTGGLDSRMILAWVPRPPFKLETYTFAGMYRECADVRIARQISGLAQQYHATVNLTRKFFPEFAGLAKRSVCFSDGCMDVSGSVELFVNRQARLMAPVRLTGNYGDEILRGHVAFGPSSRLRHMCSPSFMPSFDQALETFDAERKGHVNSFIAFKQVPWHHFSRLSVEQSQLAMRSPYLDKQLVALSYRAPRDPLANRRIAHRLIDEGDPRIGRVPTDRGFVGCNRSAGNIFRNAVQEFTVRAEYASDYGMPKWLARFDKALPKLKFDMLFLGRHKFYHFRRWYKDELASHVRSALLDRKDINFPCFLEGRVAEVVNAHLSGRANHTLEIHKLLTLDIIQRHLLDQPAAA